MLGSSRLILYHKEEWGDQGKRGGNKGKICYDRFFQVTFVLWYDDMINSMVVWYDTDGRARWACVVPVIRGARGRGSRQREEIHENQLHPRPFSLTTLTASIYLPLHPINPPCIPRCDYYCTYSYPICAGSGSLLATVSSRTFFLL